jgi:hypothetical protein
MSSIFRLNLEEELGEPPINSPEMVPLESIVKTEDLPDGTSVFEIQDILEGQEEPKPSELDFYANLAEELDEGTLNSLAIRLIEEINEDKDSRQEWENTIVIALKYTGFKVEEFKSVPFSQACAAFDTTLSASLLKSWCTFRAELFPAMGPVRSEINGVPTTEDEDRGERVKMFMNYYLTQVDRDYYPDSDRLLLYVILFGCAFRKVYQDPVSKLPVAKTIDPQDFIINHHTTSILSSNRMTHRMFLSRKEVILREMSGNYINAALPVTNDDNDNEESNIQKTIKNMEGVDTSASENKSLFTFYESHVDLSANDIEPNDEEDEYDLPRPYIVTICEATKKIVSIRRNWKEGDNTYKKKDYFVHYYYLPGFGIYGSGLAQLIGSNSIVLTSLLRQLVDAGTLRNFPGGLKEKGLRIENNDKAVGPAEFHEVETGGRAISECVMLMPYQEPSIVLNELRKELIEQTGMIAGTILQELPENSTNAPVGTTLALLEVAHKMQSSILRSLHVSLGLELKLLFNLFAEYLPDEPYPFVVPGAETAIMRQDFNDKVNIVPVSDPNVLTSTHRLLKSEALLKLAESAPDIHDRREAYHRMYSAMNVENIDKLLPPLPQPVPFDPITENMNLLLGKPLSVALFQDDDAHNVVHRKFVQEIQMNPQTSNPQLVAQMMLHIQAHEAYKILKQIPELMQQVQSMDISQLKPEDILMTPEIQNMLAMKDSQEALQAMEMQRQQQEIINSQQIDPMKVALEEVEQRRESAYLKNEESKLRAETEAFKAQTNFEGNKAKIESEKEIASEKNQVELAIAEMKNLDHI